ncbi:hypothetical protein [Aquabacterium sp.]|uniref:hypothetical protein n=1 Tax=Aquabacterium sp. TaxID=1872578 RepID=UPI0025BECCC0|nr:hypothetical protein [Aquabacterium sp.]
MSSTLITHWIVPFASSLSEPCQQALPRLAAEHALPHLRRLLSRMQETGRLEGDEYALSMPHERVLARSMGWPDADGLMPWATWWAAQDGVTLDPQQTWGMLSPGHWLMGRDHLTLLDPATLGLSETESRTVFEAIRPLFEEDGWTLLWGSAQRWYAAHPSLAGLPTASLDRVIGRNPDLWLTDHAEARMVRRLQSEVQMLLYQHPVNDAREAQGLATVNSFWLSGCGTPPARTRQPDEVMLVNDLRAPMLADDMPAWLEAWAHLDATVLKSICDALDAGQPIQLTLCGERHAVTLARVAPASLSARLWQSAKRLTSSGGGHDPLALLNSL